MGERNATSRNRRIGVWSVSGAVVALTLIAFIGAWVARAAGLGVMMYGDEQWEPVSGEDADFAARSAGAAFGDTQSFWSGRFREELGRKYTRPKLIYFTAQTPTPCAGAVNAAGPFYCHITRTATLDLTFLDLIGGRLFYRGDAGSALYVGRIAATHVQAELGLLAEWRRAGQGASAERRRALDLALALQADCLTGVWARHAADWVAAVDASFYGQLILAAREVAEGRPPGTVEPDPALLAPGTSDERTAAFGRGRDAGTIQACL